MTWLDAEGDTCGLIAGCDDREDEQTDAATAAGHARNPRGISASAGSRMMRPKSQPQHGIR
jgi:hypothetical protein